MRKLRLALESNGYRNSDIASITGLLPRPQLKAGPEKMQVIERSGAGAATMRLEPVAISSIICAQAKWQGIEIKPANKDIGKLTDEICTLRERSELVSLTPERSQTLSNMAQWLLQSSKNSPALLLMLLGVAAELSEIPSKKLARRSIAIYAPVANRFSLGELHHIIEDRAFKLLHPNTYQKIHKALDNRGKQAEQSLKKVKKDLSALLRDVGINVEEIQSRHKHYYSVYKKISKVGDVSKILDLWALRVIVSTTADCYEALGVVHEIWEPIEKERLTKDYIAKPKPNGYKSLHTIVDVEGRPIEVQIRTGWMHEVAEYGPAAHWQYDELKSTRKYKKGRTLSKAKAKRKHRLYVFTPGRDLISLPGGSTALDFAFAVHSNLGLQARAVKIDGKIAKLSDKLKSGDTVEVITQKAAKPSQGWLQFVKTAKARNRIRHQLKISSNS